MTLKRVVRHKCFQLVGAVLALSTVVWAMYGLAWVVGMIVVVAVFSLFILGLTAVLGKIFERLEHDQELKRTRSNKCFLR